MRFVITVVVLVGVATSAMGLEAGAAKTNITPPLGTPLCGKLERLGRGAVSIHDPVWVRCLYLSDGNTSLFLLSADLCAITPDLRERVLERAPRKVPPENIILTATHTFNGPGGMSRPLAMRALSGRFVPELLETTATRFAEAMQAAYDARTRAAIGYATAQQEDLSVNRREAAGPTDPQLGVVRVEDSDGNPIAILTNLAAHPDLVGDDEWLSISADYPGYYCNELESLAGGGCVALFLNGAVSNQARANPAGKTGWDRVESAGRVLAERAAEIAKAITCGSPSLHVGYAEPLLPATVAPNLLPSRTILHTLEIDDLLLTFYPGEPCAELALSMRDYALARGYVAHFTVGLADDYQFHFVPRSYYDKPYFESALSFYGPGIGPWFESQFGALMTRGEPSQADPAPRPGVAEPFGSGRQLRLSGTPYEVGYQRGVLCRDVLHEVYETRIVTPCRDRVLVPDAEPWTFAPGFVDLSVLAVPRLAVGARPMLAGLDPALREELEGLAAGAQLPFDACWLVQCAPVLLAHTPVADLYRSPFCTMFAVVGDRAGADDVRVARNFDWPHDEPFLLSQIAFSSGRRMIEIGLPWMIGGYTGMNDAGLVVCAERVENAGNPSLDGLPLHLVLRSALQNTEGLAGAVERLTAASHLRGYRVLVADAAAADGRLIEYGDGGPGVREHAEGLLLGVDPGEPTSNDQAAQLRYRRVRALLEEQRIVTLTKLQSVLRDQETGRSGQECILNETTRYSIVFEPKRQTVHIAFPRDNGGSGEYLSVDLREPVS